jgi:hypothetical protein
MALFTFPASFFFNPSSIFAYLHVCSLQFTTFWSLQCIVVDSMEEDNNRGTVIDLSYAGLNYSLLNEAFK